MQSASIVKSRETFKSRKIMQMAEPTSSTGVAGYALWKVAIALGIPAGLVSIVVMLWIQPKSPREWAMALICTVVSSISGGSYVIQKLELQDWVFTHTGLMALGGVIFACGLPGWVLVRALFAWFDKRKGKDLQELASDVKDAATFIRN